VLINLISRYLTNTFFNKKYLDKNNEIYTKFCNQFPVNFINRSAAHLFRVRRSHTVAAVVVELVVELSSSRNLRIDESFPMRNLSKFISSVDVNCSRSLETDVERQTFFGIIDGVFVVFRF